MTHYQRMIASFKIAMRYLYHGRKVTPLQHRDLCISYTMGYIDSLREIEETTKALILLEFVEHMRHPDWMPSKFWCWWDD